MSVWSARLSLGPPGIVSDPAGSSGGSVCVFPTVHTRCVPSLRFSCERDGNVSEWREIIYR